MNRLNRWLADIKSTQIIAAGFALVILTGACILMLPIATSDGVSASFSDALFTSVSAVCVTGLVVRDTATYWSGFGQVVILGLIQIGGLGVVMLAVTISRLAGKAVGIRTKAMLQDSVGASEINNIVKLSAKILRFVIVTELLGAAILFCIFGRDFGWFTGLWYAVFHSVSAFCNAGFDLMGVRSPYSSLTGYSGNGLVCCTIMLLIIFGGLGFLTWEDLRNNHWHWKRYRLQTKVILSATVLLIVIPTAAFFFVEFRMEGWSHLNTAEKLLAAFFHSITPRTAGFNTIDLNELSESGQMLTIALMLIGGAPGSTAGGMKVTTLVILLATAYSLFLGQEDTGLFHRRIPSQIVRQAAVISFMYLVMPVLAAMQISLTEKVPMMAALFETVSAMGTVGLTLGITPELHTFSRSTLMLLMYLGRVGGLSLMFAVFSKAKLASRYPAEKLSVG